MALWQFSTLYYSPHSRAAKTVLKGMFIMTQAYLGKKEKKSQMRNLTIHLKELEKEEETNFKVSRRKEIIKFGAITATKTKKSMKPLAVSLK